MGAIAEVCFAMNLHTAVDVLCLHRILLDWGLDMHLLYFTCAFIGRQHLLHFVFFFAPGAAVPDFRWPSHKNNAY